MEHRPDRTPHPVQFRQFRRIFIEARLMTKGAGAAA